MEASNCNVGKIIRIRIFCDCTIGPQLVTLFYCKGQPFVILGIGLLGGKAMGILPICLLPRPDGGSQTNHLPTDWHQETR